MQTPSQEPPASSKAPNHDLKDMDVLCSFKIKIKSQHLEHGCIKTSDHIHIMVKIPDPRQEHPASAKAIYQDLKDTYVPCTFEIKIESHKLDQGFSKNQGPYPNQDHAAKPQSGTNNVSRCSKVGLEGFECS